MTTPTSRNEIEYPALFVAASAASRRGKLWFKGLALAEMLLVMLGLAIVLFGSAAILDALQMTETEGNAVAITTATAFLGALFLRITNHSAGYEDDWYVGRAVAEAVRTESWSYMMRVGPYAAIDGNEADDAFAQKIGELLKRSRDIRHAPTLRGVIPTQISPAMRTLRAKNLAERREAYIDDRLRDQLSWYGARASSHRRWATRWFVITVVCQLVAAVSAFVALHLAVEGQMNPGDSSAQFWVHLMALLGSAALAITSWTQLNRDEELGKAYAFSLQELALVADQAERAKTEEQLAAAVVAGEAVIGRENRAWLARRVELMEAPEFGHGG